MRYSLARVDRLGNRNSNQDRSQIIETPEGVLLVLADGMGGRPHGSDAAECIIAIAQHHYLHRSRPIMDIEGLFNAIIYDAHQQITLLTHRLSLQLMPGTTVVMVLIQNGRAYWAHMGDSRLYYYRDQQQLCRTIDHSLVERLYREGAITEKEKLTHPRRNQLTRCVGCFPRPLQLKMGQETELREGDTIWICTDGVWGGISDQQMNHIFNSTTDLGAATEKIANYAEHKTYPKSDNITAIALRITEISASDCSVPPSMR